MPPPNLIPFPNRTARASAPGAHAPHANGSGGNVVDLTDHRIRELSLDLLSLALDLAGIVDPTPVSDGASALLAVARGQWFDAILSGVSMVPYVGDLAKTGKLPKYLKSIETAIDLAQRSERVATAFLPAFRKIREALNLLPRGANTHLDLILDRLDSFLKRHGAAAARIVLPDISHHFRHYEHMVGPVRHQVSEGWLGVPGHVKTHRSPTAQRNVSGGTGDDAGHQIADRFGARGDQKNLVRQNWKQNRGGGTFYDLEKQWDQLLASGHKVRVKVSDLFDAGAARPMHRKVEWEVVSPDGKSQSAHRLDFMNTDTDASRKAAGYVNPFPPGHKAKVIPFPTK
jgi:hypothetical protein